MRAKVLISPEIKVIKIISFKIKGIITIELNCK